MKAEKDNPFSFETFLNILAHDDAFAVDETAFYFMDDPAGEESMLGCLRRLDKPYWVGNCDIPDGGCFRTASEMLHARIFDGKSIKERWSQVVLVSIGGIRTDEWMDFYSGKL